MLVVLADLAAKHGEHTWFEMVSSWRYCSAATREELLAGGYVDWSSERPSFLHLRADKRGVAEAAAAAASKLGGDAAVAALAGDL